MIEGENRRPECLINTKVTAGYSEFIISTLLTNYFDSCFISAADILIAPNIRLDFLEFF